MFLQNASGKKPPRYKAAPKIKIHKQDNWKVAYDFMQKIGINTKDFEPAGKYISIAVVNICDLFHCRFS